MRLNRPRTRLLFVDAPEIRTLSSPASLPSLSRKSCHAALSCAPLARLSAHLGCAGKMRLTDICNRRSIRAPVIRSIPEPAARAAMTASAMHTLPKLNAIRITAPDHLSAIRPQVKQRLTTPSSFGRADLRPPHKEEKTSSARRQSFPRVAFSAARRVGDPTSDAPCRAPRLPVAERPLSARTASTTLASTRAAFPIRSAFHRQMPTPLARSELATVHAASPAAGRLSTLFRPFKCSRTKELDPQR